MNSKNTANLKLKSHSVISMRKRIKKNSQFPDMSEEEYQYWWNKHLKKKNEFF